MIPGFKAYAGNTNNQILGVVTDRYKVAQNEDAFTFTDKLLGEGVTYELVGGMIMRCEKCGAELSQEQKFCSVCGAKVQDFCMQCGAKLEEGARFCAECGKELKDTESIVPSQYQKEDSGADFSINTVINKVCAFFDMEQLTDDQYRNKIVKRVLLYNAVEAAVGIYAFVISYRVYENEGLSVAIATFLVMSAIFGGICWIFGIGKCQKELEKYDRVLKETDRKTAILATEMKPEKSKTGCLIVCILMLILISTMSFC